MDRLEGVNPRILMKVPNVPCGVERTVDYSVFVCLHFHVPNVPCGVESTTGMFKYSKPLTISS